MVRSCCGYNCTERASKDSLVSFHTFFTMSFFGFDLNNLLTHNFDRKAFECRRCHNLLCKPMMAMDDKTNVCKECLTSVEKESKNFITDLVLNFLMYCVPIPCRYSDSGCLYGKIPIANLGPHELECFFRKHRCPLISKGCAWQGLAKNMSAHVKNDHEDAFVENSSYTMKSIRKLNESLNLCIYFDNHSNQPNVLTVLFEDEMMYFGAEQLVNECFGDHNDVFQKYQLCISTVKDFHVQMVSQIKQVYNISSIYKTRLSKITWPFADFTDDLTFKIEKQDFSPYSLLCSMCLKIKTISCPDGHMFCDTCTSNLNQCSWIMCRKKITRNALPFPLDISMCEYSKFGCSNVILKTAKNTHEKWCKFRRFKCLCKDKNDVQKKCQFEDELYALKCHLKTQHSTHVVYPFVKIDSKVIINLREIYIFVPKFLLKLTLKNDSWDVHSSQNLNLQNYFYVIGTFVCYNPNLDNPEYHILMPQYPSFSNFDEYVKCNICSKKFYWRRMINRDLQEENLCKLCTRLKSLKCEENFTRSTDLENVFRKLFIPFCRYSSMGCNVQARSEQIFKHEKICGYRTCNCPTVSVTKCTWNGCLRGILRHVTNEHNDMLVTDGTFTLDLIRRQKNRFMIRYFVINEAEFVLHLGTRDGKLYYTISQLQIDFTFDRHYDLVINRRNSKIGRIRYFILNADNFEFFYESDVTELNLNHFGDDIIDFTIAPCSLLLIDTEETLLDCFQCAVCTEIPRGKILTCPNGHSFCETCLTVINCPTCRVQLTSKIRNYFAESIPICCSNRTFGCLVTKTRDQINSHEDKCPYRKFRCELTTDDNNPCQYAGFLSSFVNHLKTVHTSQIILCNPVVISYEFVENHRTFYIFAYATLFIARINDEFDINLEYILDNDKITYTVGTFSGTFNVLTSNNKALPNYRINSRKLEYYIDIRYHDE